MNQVRLRAIAAALRNGENVALTTENFPCFSAEATEGNSYISPKTLDEISQALTVADAATFERAAQAMDEGDLAWLGFKVIYDPVVAITNVDNAVTKSYGEQGSADGEHLVFFCNDAKEIVSSRPYSPRDLFQMKDVTRGPSMHNEQFDGLTWTSQALFNPVHVWLLGASDVASEVAQLAEHVGFKITVVDYDEAFLNEARFPTAQRILLNNDCFDGLADIVATPDDYVCVITRGHMFDPEGCLWALKNNAHYVGMMGCAGKNERVHDLVIEGGGTEEGWEHIKRPIGLKFGAKTPAELAIAIVAELVDVRYKQRYSQEAQAKHESSLGRN